MVGGERRFGGHAGVGSAWLDGGRRVDRRRRRSAEAWASAGAVGGRGPSAGRLGVGVGGRDGRGGRRSAVGVGGGLRCRARDGVGRAITTTASPPFASVPDDDRLVLDRRLRDRLRPDGDLDPLRVAVGDGGAIGLALGRADLVDLGARCRPGRHSATSRPSRRTRHRPRWASGPGPPSDGRRRSPGCCPGPTPARGR